MAEFTEVMRQYYRLCNARICTPKCPLKKAEADICATIGKAMTDHGIENVEKVIMEWAAEHPEPVYPTWLEFVKWHRADGRLVESDFDFIYWMGTTPIPADIAQKLGIEPKEG